MLGIDADPEIVQDWSDRLTHVAAADSTDEDALRRLRVQDVSHAVVGIGSDVEASVLTVVALAEIGVAAITARRQRQARQAPAVDRRPPRHLPGGRDGERVAHLITGRMLGFIEFDDGFAVAEVRAPRDAAGRPSPRWACAAGTASRSWASSGPAPTSSTPCRRR